MNIYIFFTIDYVKSKPLTFQRIFDTTILKHQFLIENMTDTPNPEHYQYTFAYAYSTTLWLFVSLIQLLLFFKELGTQHL